jgi:dihydrofolate reductase
MKTSIIVAHDDKLGIGKNNQLLFRISADLKRFKAITMGHPIIMGRKTFESIGRALPGRTNIVITRDQNYSAPGCEVAHSLSQALDLAQSLDDEEVFIIGGGEIFKLAMEQNLTDKIYVTKVKGDFKAEIFFPPYSSFKSTVFKKEGTENDYQFTFLELTK